MTTPQPETLTELKLTKLKDMIDHAYIPSDFPIMVAHVEEDGSPRMTFRGSTHVRNDEQLAFWVRHADGGLTAALAKEPRLFLVYREPTPGGGPSRAVVNMRGRGAVVGDGATREEVWAAIPQRERDGDKEKLGTAVIVDIDSVAGYCPGFRLNMKRG
jgi:hypothetical protein